MRSLSRSGSASAVVLSATFGMFAGVGPLAAAAAPPRISEVYGHLPLSFEVNEGQVDSSVKFLARGQGYGLFLTAAEAVLSLRGEHESSAVVRMQLLGGTRDPRAVGLDPQITRSNYFLGNDPRRWHTGVANYGRVRFKGVYPGVDLVYRGTQRRLEYDFVVAPGADPRRIRMAFRGAETVTIGPRGELILDTAGGTLVQPAPVLYQEARAGRRRVEGAYFLRSMSARGSDAREVGFVVGDYDRARALIIDPMVVYSTFLGGSGINEAEDLAVDGAGNAYITGITTSTDFPGVTGSSVQPAYGGGGGDAFVTKINAAGTAIVYSTYLGGSGFDQGLGIAVDAGGNAYVTGSTASATFPGVTGSSIQPAQAGAENAFVTKINPVGTAIVYSTYLGGSGSDQGFGIAVDGAGNAYITGTTTSTGFPGVSGSSIQPANGGGTDAFVTKINAAGTAIVYSTYLGGSGFDQGNRIAVDAGSNAYVTGYTGSATFPGVTGSSLQPANAGGLDAFVTKMNPAGTAIVYSTFLGGSGTDQAAGIAVDAGGNAYLTGFTTSTTFPGVTGSSLQPANGGAGDAFVTKINPAGTTIVYSTFLGGSGTDQAGGIAVDGAGNAYITGVTASTTFPGVTGSSIQPANGGGRDAFVTMINPAGTTIVYSTFLGGSGDDGGFGIAVDGAGNAYITGFTTSTTFPGVTGSSIQPAKAGIDDAFVTKISAAAPTAAIPTLGSLGMVLLALLLTAGGVLRLRRPT